MPGLSLVRGGIPPGKDGKPVPIRVHSIGFPIGARMADVKRWLRDNDLPEPVEPLKRGSSKAAKYAWARLSKVSELHRYRTAFWYSSTWGKLVVRYEIHKSRQAKRPARRSASGVRRAG